MDPWAGSIVDESSIFVENAPVPISSPLALPACVTWLRADLGIPGATNGAKFSTWNDQSPSAYVYSQATGTNQYTWNASDSLLGGMPSVTGAGLGQMLSTTTYSFAAPVTTYLVYYTTSPSTVQYLESVPGSWKLETSTLEYAAYNGTYLFSSVCLNLLPHIVCVVWNGASSAIYHDNSSNALASGTTGTGTWVSPLYLGYAAGGSLIGNQAEFIMFYQAHGALQRAQIFSYAGSRYSQAWS